MANTTRTWQLTCEFCGIEFEAKTAWARRCKADACRKAHQAEQRARNRDRGRKTNACYTVTCEICGNVYMSSKPRARYCAGRCTSVAKSLAAGGSGIPRNEREPAHEPRARYRARIKMEHAAKGRTGTGLWTQGPCNHCGTPFMCPPGGTTARYCSPRCTKRANKQRRKYRERSAPGAPITTTARWEVLRDGNFTCWLCELPLNMEAQQHEVDAPTIDHVIPLSAGGTHERNNLRPAHRYCNAVKCASEWS